MQLTQNSKAMECQLEVASGAVFDRVRDEEKLNSLTHAFGFLLSLVGFELLLTRVLRWGDAWQVAGCTIYASALVAVYAASTLSHSFEQPRLRRLFRILDQAFIFLLIAGTFTPLSLTYLRDGAWWILFGAVWTIALGGFFSKAVFAHRVDTVSTVLHISLGWLPVTAFKPMLAAVPGGLLWSMFYGGLCYTLGIFFLVRDDRCPYFHAIWHLLVIAGSAFHFWGIYTYCTIAR